MSSPIFDQSLRQLRLDRAARIDGDRFLHDRAFDDCLDRLSDIKRPFSAALIIGPTADRWITTLGNALPNTTVTATSDLQRIRLDPASFDLCLSIGALETASDLATAAFTVRHLLAPGGMLLGAIVGGNSLPRLRAAMLAADRCGCIATPRIHPSIDGPSLCALFGSVGLIEPVVEVDRLDVRYSSLDRLVADLRAMGCTNVLVERSRHPLTRRQVDIARTTFMDGRDQSSERFELLHFVAWAPPA